MKEKISFKDLNLRLKIIVVFGYSIMIINALVFLIGFIIGLRGL